jgi:two-component system CheB/CheR fusion protein
MGEETWLPTLVVIGSSAGGIEALSTLVSALPSDFLAPIVVAQHLDPQRPSHLGDILARRSRLPIQTILDHEKLEAGHVYVVPADRHVEISDGHLMLRTDRQSRPTPSINLLFKSAAQVYGEGLIAIILTGTGSDGAAGAMEVKNAGGTVVIQNPATSQYPSMPRSLPPGIVDFVVNIEDMGALLTDLMTSGADLKQPSEAKALQALLQHLFARSGLDFTSYKMTTLQRRLHRRMVATRTSTLAAYRRYLMRHPDEYPRLISSFLIKVTEFFRDPLLFAALREQIVPELVAAARQRASVQGSGWGELRLWSAGCATGEEAYSLAILIADLLGDDLDRFSVRIFATDLDGDAIAFARRGIYSASAIATLPPDLVARYFDRVDGEYVVQKRVRALVIFGEHDLAQRAPFPRIDLVLCRNVLIYFTLELQKRVLQLFAYSLRDNGYLVLGKAETTSPLPEYFMAVQPSLKIYRRYGERLLIASSPLRVEPAPVSTVEQAPTDAPVPSRPLAPARSPVGSLRLLSPQEKPRIRTSMESLGSLIFNLPIGIVVVDRRYDVQTINRTAYDLLGIERSAIGEDLLHLADRVDTKALRQVIDMTLRGEGLNPVERIVAMESDVGESRHLQITGYTYAFDGDAESTASAFLMIAALPESGDGRGQPDQRLVPQPLGAPTQAVPEVMPAGREERGEVTSDDVGQLRAEVAQLSAQVRRLSESNRTLHDANRELTSANLELHQANEEYLINAEEAQAAAEEVETLNEELQATNEELETLNEELQATVEELNATNDDLEARTAEMQDLAREQEGMRRASEDERAQLATILVSMSDAVLLVDPSGNTMLTNRAFEQLLAGGLDAGNWTDELFHVLPPDAQPRQRAARGETFTLVCILPQAEGAGRWLEAKGQPIILDGQTHGGVIVIRDITDRSLRRLQDEFIALASHELRTPLATTLMALQALMKTVEGNTDQGILQRWASVALRQVERMTLLIDDLLDVGRLQTGNLHLHREPIVLGDVVAHAVEAAQLMSPNQPIILLVPQQPLIVDGDLVRIEQVVFNLLNNAIKYAPQSPKIDVRLRQVDGKAELQVQDYGPGIADDKLPMLFARYYQAEAGSSSAQSGLGLGLFLTKELVVAHGGAIEVISQVHVGTIFTVTLPLHSSLE